MWLRGGCGPPGRVSSSANDVSAMHLARVSAPALLALPPRSKGNQDGNPMQRLGCSKPQLKSSRNVVENPKYPEQAARC